jgi:hypothetical protein
MKQSLHLRRICAVTFALLLVSRVASAQSNGRPCQGPEKPQQADRLFQMLSSPTVQQEEALSSVGLSRQSVDAPHGVLRETSLCARMRAALRRSLRPADEPAGGLDDARLSFVELGDYVAVIISDTRPTSTGLLRLGASPVYIFDKDKVRFIARLTA